VIDFLIGLGDNYIVALFLIYTVLIMQKPLIVITGKNGQLGWEFQQIVQQFQHLYEFIFTDRTTLDLSNPSTIAPFFEKVQPQYFINCAAYTQVDKAESDQIAAYTVNAESVGEIAKNCAAINCTLITISTDYVFNGLGTTPYLPNQATEPINYYGFSKQKGEELARSFNKKTIVIRTSWVYSVHGNNFVKTMLRLMKERPSLNVVGDQFGAPTYAADLAAAIMQMVYQLENGNRYFGIYHYSNDAHISWYDFAVAIKEIAGLNCEVAAIPSSAYPTPAKRPFYSVLDKTFIQKDYQISIIDWKESLKKCMQQLLMNN
jgi:dTDP-4-dehydrorhamnose reductase